MSYISQRVNLEEFEKIEKLVAELITETRLNRLVVLEVARLSGVENVDKISTDMRRRIETAEELRKE